VGVGGEPEPAAVACLVERFPAGVDDSVVNRLLTLEQEGYRIVVFALEQSAEACPAAGLERLRVIARIVRSPGGMWVRARLAGHALQLLRRPSAYVAAAGRAIRDAGRRGPAYFAAAPAIARVMRRHGVRRLIAGPGARVLAQAEVVSRLTGIPIERVHLPGPEDRAPQEFRA